MTDPAIAVVARWLDGGDGHVVDDRPDGAAGGDVVSAATLAHFGVPPERGLYRLTWDDEGADCVVELVAELPNVAGIVGAGR